MICRAQREFSQWSGLRPRWLSKEMSTLHPVLHKRIKLRPVYRCLLPTQERKDVEIKWNILPVYTKLLWSFIHSVEPPSSRKLLQAKRTLWRMLTPKLNNQDFCWLDSPIIHHRTFPSDSALGTSVEGKGWPSGKYPRPYILVSTKGSNLTSTQRSLFSHLSSCCICLYIFNK